MGKSTSLIESQHHHLLHCLEKTTVSPSPLRSFPSPPPSTFPRAAAQGAGTLRPRPRPGPRLHESESVPFIFKKQ